MPVVDRLDEVARAVRSEPGGAGLAFVARGNVGEDGFDAGIGFGRAAHHDGGTMARALLTAPRRPCR